jgi:hypothetical protein
MLIVGATRPVPRIPYVSVVFGLVVGTVLVAAAVLVAFTMLTTPFLAELSTGGPMTAGRAIVGVLAWTFAIAGPVGFGMAGLVRILGALERFAHRRPVSPTVRIAGSLGPDIHVAAEVDLPDGRPVPELVLGPFGAAVIAQMPSPKSIRRQRSNWEQRMPDGKWRPVESPLDRTVRDAERVRRWFGAADRDFVVKVDPRSSVERSPNCAVITPEQIPAWLASLPQQRGMTADRRRELVQQVRALL